jgi:hypothetical protein
MPGKNLEVNFEIERMGNWEISLNRSILSSSILKLFRNKNEFSTLYQFPNSNPEE